MNLNEKMNDLDKLIKKLANLRNNPKSPVIEIDNMYKEAVKQFRETQFDYILHAWLDNPDAMLTTRIFDIDTDEYAEIQIDNYIKNMC